MLFGATAVTSLRHIVLRCIVASETRRWESNCTEEVAGTIVISRLEALFIRDAIVASLNKNLRRTLNSYNGEKTERNKDVKSVLCVKIVAVAAASYAFRQLYALTYARTTAASALLYLGR